MIIKYRSWKIHGWKILLNYINQDQSKLHGEEAVMMYHNMPFQDSLIDAVKVFKQNEKHRNTSSTVILEHHIMSFSPLSTKFLTVDKLYDLADNYLTMAAPNCLGCYKMHFSEEHVHIHFAISHNQVNSDVTNRHSKAEFKQIKNQIQGYQHQKYPELDASLVDHDKSMNMVKHHKQSDLKVNIASLVQSIFETSASWQAFINQFERNPDLELYYQRGKLRGVLYQGKTKLRFSTLGFSTEELEQLRQKPSTFLDSVLDQDINPSIQR